MTVNKLNEIVENYINGNKQDFRDEVKKLKKIEILDLIERASSLGVSRHVMIMELQFALS